MPISVYSAKKPYTSRVPMKNMKRSFIRNPKNWIIGRNHPWKSAISQFLSNQRRIKVNIYSYNQKENRRVTFLSSRSFSRSTNLDFTRLVRFKASSALKGGFGRDPKLYLSKIFLMQVSRSLLRDMWACSLNQRKITTTFQTTRCQYWQCINSFTSASVCSLLISQMDWSMVFLRTGHFVLMSDFSLSNLLICVCEFAIFSSNLVFDSISSSSGSNKYTKQKKAWETYNILWWPFMSRSNKDEKITR